MANKVETFLQHEGTVIVNFLKKDVEPIIAEGDVLAKDSEPVVDLAFPGIAPLFNGTVAVVGTIEAATASAVANAPAGSTSAQKAALALAAAGPLFTAWMQQYGVDPSTTNIGAAINAVVAFLNALGAPGSLALLADTSTQTVGTSTVTTVKVPA